MYVSILFLGMSKVETPSPHASKKQKKCGTCHSFLTDLDPHPECNKCVPRGCSKESPCSHCAPLSLDAWKKWERQQCSKRSSLSMKGPKGDSARGGGNKSGKVCPEVPSTPKDVSSGRWRLAALESFFPHRNWRTPLLANGPSRGRWTRRLCHSLVWPPGAT